MSHNVHNAGGQLVSTGLETTECVNGMDVDEIFTLLSNSRRRAMMRVMFEHQRLDFGELVDRVAEMEYGLHIDEISSDERHNIYVSLYQTHLPKLKKSGVLEGSRKSGSIGLSHNADALVPWFAKIDGKDSFTSKLKGVFA
jgi:energy-coupling factor transporter ATP-binding protein EcfA2